MNNKIEYLIDSISNTLSGEKAYNLPKICSDYDLGEGEQQEAYVSKFRYVKNRLTGKNIEFIIKLAKKIIADYKSNSVGIALNQYFEGNFYKLSEITRRNLLNDLFQIGGLNGSISVTEFLKRSELEYIIYQYNQNDIYSFLGQPTEQPTLNELLEYGKIYEILDERFFHFLEQIIHPGVRNSSEIDLYISLINKHLKNDNFQLLYYSEISGNPVFKVSEISGIQQKVKNIIFAANGYMPEIVLEDALSNNIRIAKYAENCLIYDLPIKQTGLLWVDLVDWWANLNRKEKNIETAKDLKDRLFASLASEPEKVLFDIYFSNYAKKLNKKLPALIPQVYLHYDPYSIKKFGIQYLLRQRMDFLFLFSNSIRIVIEVDGKQHYSENDIASPKKYSEMVSLDRDLKLLGYEVYRFGGFELTHSNRDNVIDFFDKLFEKHKIFDPE